MSQTGVPRRGTWLCSVQRKLTLRYKIRGSSPNRHHFSPSKPTTIMHLVSKAAPCLSVECLSHQGTGPNESVLANNKVRALKELTQPRLCCNTHCSLCCSAHYSASEDTFRAIPPSPQTLLQALFTLPRPVQAHIFLPKD